MTTLSAARTRGYMNSQENAFPIDTTTTIWGGAFVGVNPATGKAGPMQTGWLGVGFAKSSVNHVRGQQRDNFVTVIDSGQVVLEVSGAVQADVGKDVYATDDDTFTLTSTGGSFVGVAKQFVSSGKLLVAISPPFNLNVVRRSSDGRSLVDGDGSPMFINRGYRTVLFGDSMTETEYAMDVASSASYSVSTGVLTVSYTGHQQLTGWYVRLFNRNHAPLLKGQVLPVTRVDANTFTVQLAANLALPNGTLTGSTQLRFLSWFGSEGFATWFKMASGWRFNVVFNGAQSGDTVANALDRLQSDCLDYDPQVVVMQIPGINDTSAGNGPVSEDTTWSGMKDLVNRITGHGATLILLNVTPVAASEAAGRATLQNMARVIRLNKRLAEYCASVPGVILFDAWGMVVSPTDTTGLATAAMLRTAPDAIHYSQRGGRAVGEALWAQIKEYFPSKPEILPKSVIDNFVASAATLTSATMSSNVVTATLTAHGFNSGETVKVIGGTSTVFNDYVPLTRIDSATFSFPSVGADGACTGTILVGRDNNLFVNHMLTTATGGTVISPGTGVAASNIRIENTAGAAAFVGSVVSRSDGFGNNQRVVITPGAANDQCRISNGFSSYTTDLPAVVKAERTYYAEAELSLSGVSGSNLSETRFNLELTVGGVAAQSYALNGYSLGPVINTDGTFHVRTASVVLPAGAVTLVRVTLLLRFSASGTALTVEVGRIALREIDPAVPT